MTIADQARENAIQCEMVLYAYRKNKDGVVVSFVVHPNDMPTELATAPIGARFVSALVQVGDDETPVNRREVVKASAPTATPRRLDKPAGAKPGTKPWRDMKPQQQAGMRIDEPNFATYLRETYPDEWRETQDADACLKMLCGGIASKRELETNHMARTFWHSLDRAYAAWKALEHA